MGQFGSARLCIQYLVDAYGDIVVFVQPGKLLPQMFG